MKYLLLVALLAVGAHYTYDSLVTTTNSQAIGWLVASAVVYFIVLFGLSKA